VRLGLLQASLPGRFQILPGQPAVILDVAHNPHAAAVLAQNLDNMGFHPYTHAVFGMLNDKDLAGVIAKLGTRIDNWYCAGLPGPRGTSGDALAEQVAAALPPAPADGEKPGISAYPDPAQAFAAARERAGENDRIVVFGSFLTVASVLQALGRKA
jgi:dihydrofolate synthase/folylpolyglutamate synthase